MNFRILFLTVVLSLFIFGCATYKTKYSGEVENWKTSAVDELPAEDSIAHTVYLVGDAGYKSYDSPALIALKKKTDIEDENSTIVFLGDNIYPGGLPPADSFGARLEAERVLIAQMEIIDDSKAYGFFVAGNHDSWYYQTKGVRRQADFVNAYLNRGIEDKDDWEEYFLPEDGCPGPEVVEINDNLVIIAINSQWWLQNWDRDPDINYGCDVKTRAAFTFWFEETLRKHRNKNVIIAMHHPLVSYGPHGGRFTLKEHVFPLTQLEDNLFIPLVPLGTITALVRSAVGFRQDISNPLYNDLKNALVGAAQKNGSFIFAAGHEHNLQYIEKDDQSFVVSGAGSKEYPVALGQSAKFTSGSYGFAQIDFHYDGSAWITYWGASHDNKEGEMLFRYKMRDALPLADDNIGDTLTFPSEMDDSYTSKVVTYELKEKGSLHKAIYGEHYRDLYKSEFEFPALILDTFAGGVKPVKVGGGGQTNSLRLENAEGKQYVMRSTTKDASRFIPYPFNKITPVKDLVKESFLAAHPFAATILPSLADEVKVYHTTPKMYYIPKQPTLGRYNELFGDEVYLLEERPDEDNWENADNFGSPDDIISTHDVIDNLRKSEKYIIDQPWVARSRLFDHLIGDWDRHDDQWRWAVFKKDDNIKLYRPIPRDRDQAFSRYDGFVGAFSRSTVPFLRQLRNYGPEIGNIKWSTYNGRQFDKTFLNQLSWEQWKKEAEYLQSQLTDEVIDRSFERWPEQVKADKFTPELISALKYRRDNIVKIAREYYEHLAKDVEITGTNDPDLFEVVRSDETTHIWVWELKKGEKKDKIYERVFINDETNEIRLFGFESKDKFKLSGEGKNGIKIRIIGGTGEDLIEDKSKVSGLGKKTKVYDTATKNILDLGKEAKDMTSDIAWKNQYHRRDPHYEYDFLMTFPVAGFNPDDGLFLGAQFIHTQFAFKKRPYAQQHTLTGQYAFATNAYNFDYQGEFKEVVGKWDFLLNGSAAGSRFVENFFGFGNETTNPFNDNFDFNRVRQSNYSISPSIRKYFGTDKGRFNIGLLAEHTDPERTAGRITADENQMLSGLNDPAFKARTFVGGFARIDYENTNHKFLPTRGLKFTLGAQYRLDLSDTKLNFANYWSNLTFYQTFLRSQRITLASQLGWSMNTGDFGEDFQFYQAVRLGSHANLRGYRQHRFHGKSMLYHNTDIRVKVLTSEDNSLFSSSVGVLVGFDYGRVWTGIDGDNSQKWHNGYGGGLWVAPLDFFMILGQYFVSEEDERFTVNIKYSF